MTILILDDKVYGEQTKRSTLASPSVYENSSVLSFGLFDEVDDCIDDILINDVLNIVLGPVEGQETHSFDCRVVLAVSSCAVDDMGDLIERQPLDVLSR